MLRKFISINKIHRKNDINILLLSHLQKIISLVAEKINTAITFKAWVGKEIIKSAFTVVKSQLIVSVHIFITNKQS